MSTEAQFVCYLLAFLLFALAAAGVTSARYNLIGAGLAAWVFVALVTTMRAL